jgi:RHS repeat-associated protein
MRHLQQMVWDFEDQLHYVKKGSEEIYYVYDAAGQRVRKVVEKNNNGALIEERIYLGGFEVFRRSNGNGLKLERETLHIMDDQQRIALVETRTKGDDDSPEQVVRYQLGNHLGSSSLELDEGARMISYEEYYPYGSTSYQAVNKEIKAAAKRYRYTGKERDDETGLYYYGARYYAAWLGWWCSCDPIGISDSLNLYAFAHLNPIRFIDARGTDVDEYFKLMQSREEDRREGTKYLNEMKKRISEKSKKRQKLLNEVPPESSPESPLYEQGLYTAYYQLRKEAVNYDWYDPRNWLLSTGALVSFVGGSLIDLFNTPGKFINAVDPTGEGQITLMQLSQSFPGPFDDLVAATIRSLGRSAKSWAPSYFKMNVACSLAQSDINVITKALNLGFKLEKFSGISPELGTLRLRYTSGSELFYALRPLGSSGARWAGLRPEPFNTLGFTGKFQVDPAFLPKRGPLAIYQLKLEPGIPYLESYVNPSPMGFHIPGFEENALQFLFRSPVPIRKVKSAGFKKK